MRAATAYFAGAGTVIAAIVGGVGGGLLIADMISPKSPRQATEMTRLERRMSPEPIPATATALEPVPYLSAPQPSAPGAAVATAPVQAQAQADAANSEPTRAKPADTSTAAQPAAPAAQAAAPVPQPAAPAAQPVAREQATAPGDAFAKARDTEVKRAEEKRKAERRQQWTERRRQRQQQELIVVEEKVRQETEPRREFVSEPVKIEMPQIRLFGPE
jgi:hypothetical protein